MKRRLIRWLIRPLAVGALVTIAVTWGLAALLPQRNWKLTCVFSDFWPSKRSPLIVSSYETRGAVRRTWALNEAHRAAPPFAFAIDSPAWDGRVSPARAEIADGGWGRLANARTDPDGAAIDGCEHATGWPLLSGWYEVVQRQPSGAYTLAGGIVLQEQGPAAGWRALPLHPIWRGFVLDTLFYAAIWLLPFGAVTGASRAWRRRHNRCTRCGYSLAGLPDGPGGTAPCPECGTPQRRRAASSGAPG